MEQMNFKDLNTRVVLVLGQSKSIIANLITLFDKVTKENFDINPQFIEDVVVKFGVFDRFSCDVHTINYLGKRFIFVSCEVTSFDQARIQKIIKKVKYVDHILLATRYYNEQFFLDLYVPLIKMIESFGHKTILAIDIADDMGDGDNFLTKVDNIDSFKNSRKLVTYDEDMVLLHNSNMYRISESRNNCSKELNYIAQMPKNQLEPHVGSNCIIA